MLIWSYMVGGEPVLELSSGVLLPVGCGDDQGPSVDNLWAAVDATDVQFSVTAMSASDGRLISVGHAFRGPPEVSGLAIWGDTAWVYPLRRWRVPSHYNAVEVYDDTIILGGQVGHWSPDEIPPYFIAAVNDSMIDEFAGGLWLY